MLSDFKYNEDLVSNEKKAESVKNDNITLCITNNALDVSFEDDSWYGVARMLISGCR